MHTPSWAFGLANNCLLEFSQCGLGLCRMVCLLDDDRPKNYFENCHQVQPICLGLWEWGPWNQPSLYQPSCHSCQSSWFFHSIALGSSCLPFSSHLSSCLCLLLVNWNYLHLPSPSSRFAWCSLFLLEWRLARSMVEESIEEYLDGSNQINHLDHLRRYKFDLRELIYCIFYALITCHRLWASIVNLSLESL